jgi:hypothetical protein
MVVYTPLPPLPITPDVPHAYLNQRIDTMSEQLAEMMTHFHTLSAPHGATSPAVRPGIYATVTLHPVVSPDTPPHHPILVPTPDFQGPPPAVTASTADLIGNHPAIHLTYTPRSQASNRQHTPPRPLLQSDFWTSEATKQLHSSQWRDELFVSGYY